MEQPSIPGSDQSRTAFVCRCCMGLAFRLYQQETFFYFTLHNVVTNKQWKFNFLRQPPSTGENSDCSHRNADINWIIFPNYFQVNITMEYFFLPLLAFICDSGRKHSYWGGWEGGNIFLIQLNLQHVAFRLPPSTGSPNKRTEFYLFCMFALTKRKVFAAERWTSTAERLRHDDRTRVRPDYHVSRSTSLLSVSLVRSNEIATGDFGQHVNATSVLQIQLFFQLKSSRSNPDIFS